MSTTIDKALDVRRIRRDFPILARSVRGRPLAYLDNAATTQKPRSVIEAVTRYYETTNSNVHRGVHTLSQEATEAYEGARRDVARFLNAPSEAQIVFTRGATESINLVAASFGEARVGEGDEVLVTEMEHHSNIVPWQLLCERRGARLVVLPIDDRGELRLDLLPGLLTDRARIVAVAHASNALGTVNPVKEIARIAHARAVPVLVDGAQAAPHLRVDVQDLGCDFYAFSGHKTYGPTGVGALWGRPELLEEMPPWQGGGEMILSVSFAGTVYNRVPAKFEAGTPNIAGAIGLGAAIRYLESLDAEAIRAHEDHLLALADAAVAEVPGLRVIGTAREKTAILSFVVEGAHPHDVGTILDARGVAVRAGHHCAQPVMERFGVPATTRASFALYNTEEEVERFAGALHEAMEILG